MILRPIRLTLKEQYSKLGRQSHLLWQSFADTVVEELFIHFEHLTLGEDF